MEKIVELRNEIDKINNELLKLLNERAKIAINIGEEKLKTGQPIYDPIREQQILETLIDKNDGPFSDETIISLFKEIFKASTNLQEVNNVKSSLVSRKMKKNDTIITIKNTQIGKNNNTFIFGPCSIESYDQLEKVAKVLKENGLKFIRGGAFKPRTSPYEFQGLGIEALKMMKDISDRYDLISVVEIMDKDQLSLAEEYVDIIQVGTRNMQNYSLLKALGSVNKPVILKRGYAATIEEFKLAAEYIISSGNENVILCERGIRTFERATRNTLDISAVPILKKETHLPVIVDVSHAAGRKDILTSLAKASLAAGADGIMAEIHPNPKVALSDAAQQMNFVEFNDFYQKIK
ncbi:MAG: keto-3-deoxy-D-arabino-heptulosonate-7-phosphate synthase beta [Haloplasmataceae bacterium]|jgi:3-deoxy-7-phosphoheptulonate synthase/chorismate mutase|nr:keto-3-deoxy-D-arabino-heptulosonate-7-phosphate synthase beta [Haloplasmataceae bacterium]